MINSFYSWTEFSEKHYKDIFAGIRREFYDNNLEYRLLFELRTCATHKMLPIHTIKFFFDKEEKLKIEIAPQFLIEYGNINKTKIFYKELNKMKEEGKKIDIKQIIVAMNMNMPGYERALLRLIKPSISSRVHALIKDWPNRVNLVALFDEDEKPVTGNLIAPVNEYHKLLNTYSIQG